jgi:hypothetical protein
VTSILGTCILVDLGNSFLGNSFLGNSGEVGVDSNLDCDIITLSSFSSALSALYSEEGCVNKGNDLGDAGDFNIGDLDTGDLGEGDKGEIGKIGEIGVEEEEEGNKRGFAVE